MFSIFKFSSGRDVTNQAGGVTVIGEGLSVLGRLKVPGKVTVNGRLDGELVADELIVGPTGALFGTVQARRVDVHGQTHNSVTASEYLLVRSRGQMHGLAAYGQLEIELGGRISGTLSPIDRSAELDVAENGAQTPPIEASLEQGSLATAAAA